MWSAGLPGPTTHNTSARGHPTLDGMPTEEDLTVFAAGRVEQRHFVRVATDQAVHRHFLLLADAVATRHGLEVVLRGRESDAAGARAHDDG
jgi:hypothetical protein